MLRIAFAGTPEFAVPALAGLAGSAHTLVGVLTQPDRPSGRGLTSRGGPVKQLAGELGIPVAQPARLAQPEDRALLASWMPELLVVVAYGLILPPSVLALPRLGCLNIHASLLPRWRGAAPIQRAILAGDTRSGVTIMQMEAGLDTGPMLAQRVVPIEATTSAATLHALLADLGADLLLEVIAAIEAGQARPQPQSEHGATYASKIDKREARIDWRHSAQQIARQVQAFNPWPVAYSELARQPLRLWSARALPDAAGEPGEVLGLTDAALHVRCGEGVLAIDTLQRAGRRVLSAREFASGLSLAGLRLT